MKKILFNDRFGLTNAVLEGRKTMTRRIVPEKTMKGAEAYVQKTHGTGNDFLDYLLEYAPFKPGEVVAVAQSYKDTGNYPESYIIDEFHPNIEFAAGWNNKMFVRADLMIHQIQITNVRVERLQDISDEDVFREGFEKQSVNNGWGNAAWHWESIVTYMDYLGRYKFIRSPYPREAFACLIDKIYGKGTWESNPLVFVYEFELVK